VKPGKYREQRKAKYSKHRPEGTPLRVSLHTCTVCGKQCFESRRSAKSAAPRIPALAGKQLRYYQCNGYWHMTSVPADTMGRYREMDFRRTQHAEDHG
jgi:hypothetical protein